MSIFHPNDKVKVIGWACKGKTGVVTDVTDASRLNITVEFDKPQEEPYGQYCNFSAHELELTEAPKTYGQIQAVALREASEAFEYFNLDADNKFVKTWLNERADALEKK